MINQAISVLFCAAIAALKPPEDPPAPALMRDPFCRFNGASMADNAAGIRFNAVLLYIAFHVHSPISL
jgi:hypothetical protein